MLNYRFVLGLALRKRLKSASVEKIAQDRVFDDFCESLLPENRVSWTAEVVAWENDTTLPSPYQNVLQGTYINIVDHIQLAHMSIKLRGVRSSN